MLFVFDSMDEMPTSGHEYIARVNAIADFIDSGNESNLYIITCRYLDFIKLADYSQDLRIQRLDVLPWTEPMVRGYLASVAGVGQNRQEKLLGMVREAHGYGDRRSRSEKYYEPLIVALISRIRGGRGAGSLAELWDSFVAQRLSEVVAGTGPGVDQVSESLSRLAYHQLWPNEYDAAPEVIDAACRAGLMRRTIGEVNFEIRPLMSHLAAKELLRRVRSYGRMPKNVAIEDINKRDVFRCTSAQSGTDPRWSNVVTKVLATKEGTLREHGDRLEFVASCMTAEQLEANSELRSLVARIVEGMITFGDHVDKERCQAALEQQPALLDSNIPNVAVFFAWAVTQGSSSVRRWLLTVLSSNRTLRSKFRRIWWRRLPGLGTRASSETTSGGSSPRGRRRGSGHRPATWSAEPALFQIKYLYSCIFIVHALSAGWLRRSWRRR